MVATTAVLAFPLSGDLSARAVRTPVWRLAIEGRDVTREISPMVRSVTYTDHTHGESDELEIEVEDRNGLWRESWYPTEGDRVELVIGYQGESLLPCGRFAIDEFESSGPPDVMTLRALAAGPIPAFRTRRSAAYEGQTLRQIAEAVAARHGLRLLGTIRNIRIERVTQSREDDLTFLRRLAEAYGYVFSIRGDQLIFFEVATLEAASPTWRILRTDVGGHRLRSATRATYRECEVSYHDPLRKQLVKRTVEAKGVKTGDTYKLHVRAETAAQAEEQARATLHRLNRKRTQGTLELEGNPRVVAGSNGTLSGWGKFDGTYQVMSSRHRIGRDTGYTLEIEVVGLG